MGKYILGVSAYYHDSSACLFIDNQLVFACEEEKFTGIKHDNSFPINTINYILEKYNIGKKDISCVCYYENPKLRLKRRKSFIKSLINIVKVWYNLRKLSKTIHYSKHHISHMMYSYLTSNFERSTVISIDGVGETETVSIGTGINGNINQIKTISYPHSLGLYYSAMTSFLGFKPNEGEYKVMGLASYGKPSVYYDKVKELIKYENDTIICNMKYFTWDSSKTLMFNEYLEDFLDIECRLPNDKIKKPHIHLAAAVQKVYEEVLFGLLNKSLRITHFDNLCLGGGCAYNGSANGKILEKTKFKHLWIPPAPSDAGSSIGACLDYIVNELNIKTRIGTNPFLGPEYSDREIFKVIDETKNIKVRMYYCQSEEILKHTCKLLNEGLVVGWFQNKIEFGARALGNRSILADPTLSYMKDKINKVIKKRESFRPFAPAVCFDEQKEYFDTPEFIPYMNQVVKVKEKYKDKLLAVTHVDGTSRIQSVTPFNPLYNLLKEYKKVSGYPILLNTSFNIKDKTMVLTPQDAMDTFLNTEMDALVMGCYIIRKKICL